MHLLLQFLSERSPRQALQELADAPYNLRIKHKDDGRVLLNEINTMPGFTQTSVYAKLWEASGLTYPELCSRLVDLALERHRREAAHSF